MFCVSIDQIIFSDLFSTLYLQILQIVLKRTEYCSIFGKLTLWTLIISLFGDSLSICKNIRCIPISQLNCLSLSIFSLDFKYKPVKRRTGVVKDKKF